jgi:hypothetical protein
VSEARYELLNSLYDRVVTFRLKELNAAWKAIQAAEKKHEAAMEGLRQAIEAAGRGVSVAYEMTEPVRLILQARNLAASVPISEKEAHDPAIAGAFQELKPGQKAAGRQAEFEAKWDAATVKNYAEAKALAERALAAR